MINQFRTLATLSIICVLASCGGDDAQDREQAMEQQAKKYGIDADVTLNDNGEVGSVKIKQGGVTVGSNLQLPADFPSDIPIAKSWNIMSVASAPKDGYSMQATTSQNMADAVQMVRDTFQENGWEEKGFLQPAPQMTSISMTKSDRLTNLNIIDQGGPQLAIQLLTMKHP